MAKFWLVNNTYFGSKFLIAGSSIDDTIDDAAGIRTAGGVLWPQGDATVDAAAAQAQAMKLRASALSAIESVMQSAVQNEQRANDTVNDGWQKAAADGAAGTATAETVWFRATMPFTIQNLVIQPSAALTSDNSNNATLTVRRYDSAGNLKGTVAALTTNVASGSWVANVAKDMGAITNGVMAKGDSLTVQITKGGTGVVVPVMLLALQGQVVPG